MSGLADPPKVSFAPTVTTHGRGSTRSIPVLSSSVTSANPVPRSSPVHHDPLRSVDPMDVSTSSATMAAPAPPARSSPDSDRATGGGAGGAAAASAAAGSGANGESGSSNNGPNQAIGAAAAAQQPKVVQTAFIHKLYKYARLLLLLDYKEKRKMREMMLTRTVCWRIPVSNISSPGPIPTTAL